MAKGKAFDRPVAVAVEGIDFLHLMRTQFDGAECTDLWLFDIFEDREDSRHEEDPAQKGNKQTRWLRNFHKQAKEAGNFATQTLAIIRDAEDSSDAQFHSVCAALEAVGLPKPAANGQFETGEWEGRAFRTGVLVIPPDAGSGCLETCLLRAPKENFSLAPAWDFQAAAEAAAREQEPWSSKLAGKTPGGLSRWQEKVRVRAMIAASPDDPGQKLGTSGAWLWDFTRQPLKAMIDFVQSARAPVQ
jgi:hypothetical protein